MPTPRKPYAVLAGEGKSHRTRAELEQRKKAEDATLTGNPMSEGRLTKENAKAHKKFLRLKKLLGGIGKDDAIYEAVINRYCVMSAEAEDLEQERERLRLRGDVVEQQFANGELEEKHYDIIAGEIVARKLECDRALATKRKMLLDIEKENIMTVASALRSVPKAAPQEDEQDDPMAQLLARKKGGW